MSRVTIDTDQVKSVSCLRIVELGDRQGIARDTLKLAGISEL